MRIMYGLQMVISKSYKIIPVKHITAHNIQLYLNNI